MTEPEYLTAAEFDIKQVGEFVPKEIRIRTVYNRTSWGNRNGVKAIRLSYDEPGQYREAMFRVVSFKDGKLKVAELKKKAQEIYENYVKAKEYYDKRQEEKRSRMEVDIAAKQELLKRLNISQDQHWRSAFDQNYGPWQTLIKPRNDGQGLVDLVVEKLTIEQVEFLVKILSTSELGS